MGFFDDLLGVVSSFQDFFSEACDYFRYDSDLFPSCARMFYNQATFLLDIGFKALTCVGSLTYNITGTLISGSSEKWDQTNKQILNAISDTILAVDHKLTDWGINTRFYGDVIDCALLVPSLRDIGKSAEEVAYTHMMRSMKYDECKKMNQEFKEKVQQELKKAKDAANVEKNKINNMKISEAKKKEMRDKIDTELKIKEKAAERRIENNWNLLKSNIDNQYPDSFTGIVSSRFKDQITDFNGYLRSRFNDCFSFAVSLEGKDIFNKNLKLKQQIDHDFKEVHQMIHKCFLDRLNGVMVSYQVNVPGLRAYEVYLQNGLNALKAPPPSYVSGVVDHAVFGIERLAAFYQNYNMACMDIAQNGI